MRAALSLVVVVSLGCGDKAVRQAPGTVAEPCAGPMPVSFGDCAGVDVAFEVGKLASTD